MLRSLQEIRRALPELERRNRYAAGGDGFSIGSSSVGIASTGGSAGIAAPTERAALTRKPLDPVRDWSKEMLFQLETASKAIERADNKRRIIFDGDGPPVDFDAVNACDICGKQSDELKTGRCPADYQFRRRNGFDRQKQPTEVGSTSSEPTKSRG